MAATPGRQATNEVATAKVSSVLALSTTVTSARNGKEASRKVRSSPMRSARVGASL